MNMATQQVRSGRGRGYVQRAAYEEGWSPPRSFRDEWRPAQRADGKDGLTEALGWFSIGLGAAQLMAPRSLARFIGIRDNDDTRTTMMAIGLREIMSGMGILTQRNTAGWIWARAGGDVMDLALLGAAFNSRRNNQGKVAAAIAAVLGVAILDFYESQQLRIRHNAARPFRQDSRSGARRSVSGRREIYVTKTITINRSPEEVYRFWHNFENLPRFMSHLESVQVTGERRSHWKAKAPAGMTVEWDAEVIEDLPNELIAWRSVEGADVPNSGLVRFKAGPAGQGTELRVELRYHPPGGRLGAMIAKLFGEEPEQQVKGDLRRFKQVMETGEIVHSDSSIHRGMHPARPAGPNEQVTMVGR
jgi:uncharacterized membrane protein